MSTIRTSRGGPLIRSKTAPLVPQKGRCFRVLCRRMREPNLGRWEPISTSGFQVVCRSYLEAAELCWLVGIRHFTRPSWLDKGDDKDDERYLDWLLEHHLKIEPYTAGQPMEVTFAEFIKGWYPDASDIPGMSGGRAVTRFVEQMLRNRWEGK